jgi:hypothetical protein
MTNRDRLAVLLLFCFHAGLEFAQVGGMNDLRSAFESPPADCRIMMRWWWFGPGVSKPELERELRAMQAAGIGGVELQPVYPLALDDPERGFHNMAFLSDQFIENVGFAAQKARALGLRFDITLGSGWPFGGPHIPITQAAGELRVVSVTAKPEENGVAAPNIGTGEKLLAAFLSETGQPAPAAQMLSLNGVRDGRLGLAPSPKPRVITFYIFSRTGMMVKRPAIGAEGLVLDHFEQAAIETHLHTVGDRLLSAFGSNPPYSVFSDSLEVYGSNWTGDLLPEFERRRGYDLTPRLPALIEDAGPETAEIRHDWGQTLTELINERYLAPVRTWAEKHGTRFRSQTYGIPAVSLSSNRLADLPEGEGDPWRSFSPSRWASSASHLYGSNITSAETWTWLHSPAFRATSLDMKADADRFFLEGINQIVGHGWPYSPPGIPDPGWSFYAAGAFNDHNPWWPVMVELSLYLQRLSYLLRQGKPIVDVALLLPTDDAWSAFTTRNASLSEAMPQLLGANVIPQILDAGLNFDFIDAEAIEQGGIAYPVLILPGVERLPLKTYAAINEYAKKGGIVIATRSLPSKAPGRVDSGKDSVRIGETSRELFEGPEAKGFFVQDEHQLGAAIRAHFESDVSTDQLTGDLGFVHRRLPFADVYFLVNTSNHPLSATAKFHTQMQNPEWWDPFSGKASPAGEGRQIALPLAPYESRVLVFTNVNSFSPPKREAPHNAGDTASTSIELATNWTLAFPTLRRNSHLDTLRSWTADEETRFYSGEAIYDENFFLPVPTGERVYLDFGPGILVAPLDKHSRFFAGIESPVREVAQIFVNQRSAGFIWKPPYRVEITSLLRNGGNHLRLVVYNTAINEIAGRALPDLRLLNDRYGQRFTPQDVDDIQPLPSGLLNQPRLRLEKGP